MSSPDITCLYICSVGDSVARQLQMWT